MLYACAILAVQLIALLVRRLSKNRVSLGWSLVIGVLPLVLLIVLVQPLALLAARVCASLGLTGFASSFEEILIALSGTPAPDSRLAYYLTALSGFKASPIVGSLFGAEKLLSYHSEVFDLLSGGGIIGTAVFGAMVWLMGRGLFKGAKRHAQLGMMTAAFAVIATLGTVFYSRDIMAVYAIGALVLLEEKS